MKSATNWIALLLATLAMPAAAQTFAPLPRALAPVTALHPCMAPPQGQGPTSAECKRACEREPQAAQCPKSSATPATPNWNAPVAPVAERGGAVPGASTQFADGSVRTAAPALSGAAPGTPASPLSSSSAGAPPAPMPMAPRPSPSAQQRTPAPLAPTQATPVTTPAVNVKPVQPSSQAASRAAASATMPGAAESPRIQAESFVVDFGKAFSGDQVRRTVVLNMTAAGEAEFTLNAPAALGFGIAEVRAMGAGASAPQSAGGTSLSRRDNTMAVRNVAQRVSAPPWKLRVSEPTELQIDVVYAPKFDAFNNMAGAKSVQLDARVRNVSGSGMGLPFELRASFQGVALAPIVVPAERELVIAQGDRSIDLQVTLTSTGQKGSAVVRLVSAHPGIRAPEVATQLVPGQTTKVTLALALSPLAKTYAQDDVAWNVGAGRYPLTVDVSGQGFSAKAPLVIEVVDYYYDIAFDCNGQIPAYFNVAMRLNYDAASRTAACGADFTIDQSNDWFRSGGAFDWRLLLANVQVVARSGWSYPGGSSNPEQKRFKSSCGKLTRDQYIHSFKQRAAWQLICTPK